MNILIITDPNLKGYSKIVQNCVKTQQQHQQSFLNFIICDFQNLDDYIPKDPQRFPDKKNQLRIQKFNSIDIIIGEISNNIKPWDMKARNLCQFILICFECKKYLFGTGGIQNIIIYLCATNFQSSINILNGYNYLKKGSNGSQIKDLQTLHKNFSQFQDNDYFLDQITGDLYQYQKQNQQSDDSFWTPMANIGLHYLQIQKEQNQAISQVNRHWKQNINNNLYLQTKFEQILSPKKNFIQHELFHKIENQFIVELKNHWVMHNFNFLNKDKQFKVILESKLNVNQIFMKNQTAGLTFKNFLFTFCFQIDIKYPISMHILNNFINMCYKNQLKFENQINCEVYFQDNSQFYNNQDIQSNQQVDIKIKKHDSQRAFQGINNSIGYSKCLKGAIRIQQQNLNFDEKTLKMNFDDFLFDNVDQKTISRPISAIKKNIQNVSQQQKRQKKIIHKSVQDIDKQLINLGIKKENVDKNFFSQSIIRKFLHPNLQNAQQQSKIDENQKKDIIKMHSCSYKYFKSNKKINDFQQDNQIKTNKTVYINSRPQSAKKY